MENDGCEAKVLVAPVGDPSSWSHAIYECENQNETKESYYSLVCAEKPDLAVLAVQDSIVFPTIALKNRNELYDNCRTYTPCVSGSEIKSYRELAELAEQYSTCVFSDFLKNIENKSIVVLPSLGQYEDRCEKRVMKFQSLATPDIIRSLATIKLYEKLKDLKCDRLIVNLDMTHGLNYFGSLIAQALKDAASVLSISKKHIQIKYFSAIPVVQRKEYRYLKVMMSEMVRLVSYEDNLNYTLLNAIRFAIDYNAPLLLLTYLYRHKEGFSEIEKDREEVEKKLTCLSDDSVKVEYNLEVLPHLITKFSNTYYYILLKEIRRNYRAEPDQKGYFAIEEVKNVGKNIFNFSEASKDIILTELSVIERGGEEMKDGSVRLLKTLFKNIYEKDSERHGESNEIRNFRAHAGLKKEFTKVKKHEDKLYLAYDIKKLQNFLSKHRFPAV